MLEASAELLLDDALGEARVVTHHIDFLLFLHSSLSFLLSALESTSLALWLLEVVGVVLCKDVTKVDTLVDERGFNQL